MSTEELHHPNQPPSLFFQELASRFGLASHWRLLLAALALILFSLAAGQWWFSREVAFDAATVPTVTLASEVSTADQVEGMVRASPVSGLGGIDDAETDAADSSVSEIVVHVAGAVNAPGVIRLPPKSRIVNAVEAAGGATHTADMHRLNLAQTLNDGTSIVVPNIGQEMTTPLVRSQDAGGEQAGDGSPTAQSSKVNINTADVDELQSLNGVGPATAEAIIDWRRLNGSFQNATQLLAVPGIGPAKLEAMRSGVLV